MNDVSPTGEQRAILEAKGRIIKINARAGTGRTTTLRMLAEKFPDQRVLYLVFNRRAKEAAREAFPSNVRAHTLHALAYRGEGYKWEISTGFGPADLLPLFRHDPHVMAGLTFEFLTFFLNSAHERLEDATESFTGFLAGERLACFRDRTERVVAGARDLAASWYRKQKPCPHDFYLKLFHKSGGFVRELNRYDMVLVDEGQDLSPIMLDALGRCRPRIVVVGDTHQQIYGFRYAMDAMNHMDAQEEFDLSLSFRFGKPIANLATALIREAKHKTDFIIQGNPKQKSTVRFFEYPGGVPGDAAILSRTNLALFDNAIQLRMKNLPFQFERDLQPTLFRTLDVFRLQEGKREEIRDPFIGSFSGYDALKRYADTMEDFPLAGMCQIVEKHGDLFPGVIYDMANRCRGQEDECRQGVTLSTVHSAKGQQYRVVYVHQDIADNLDRAWSGEGNREDINVAYVAVTRPSEKLCLYAGFKQILTSSWQQMMERLDHRPAKQGSPETVRAALPELKRVRQKVVSMKQPGHPRSGKPARELPVAYPSPASSFTVKVGDRAKTPLGPGEIVEIREQECLVALDNGPARVWRPISTVVSLPLA